MAIEGPLQELGIHDVFQLLDLSRKTGVLNVNSHLRGNEGLVAFDEGDVVYAEIRSNPVRLGELLLKSGKIGESDLERARAIQVKEGGARRLGEVLVAIGALTERELRHHIEHQVAEVVFELLSWQEGFFSFSEGPLEDVPAEAAVKIRVGSLLMEGARRIDEWSRIERVVPHVGVVPRFAPLEAGADATGLELLPAEWELLGEVNGESDVRKIAQALRRSEFDVAKEVFGLVTTGVLVLHDPLTHRRPSAGGDAGALLAAAELRLGSGDFAAAVEAALAAGSLLPGEPRLHLVLARAHLAEGRLPQAVESARRALRLDPESGEAHRWLALALAATGRFSEAGEHFTQCERLLGEATPAADRETIASARAATAVLRRLLEGARG